MIDLKKGDGNHGKIDEKVHRGFQEANNRFKTAGRSTSELMREYDLTKTSINTWMRQYTDSGKFGVVENLSGNEKELRILRKENKQLRMENDILKQAA